MSTYTFDMDTFRWAEAHIYGSSRIGVYLANKDLVIGGVTQTSTLANNEKVNTRGKRNYELANHLGNILVVISDKRQGVCTQSGLTNYQAEIVSATDYYAFGSAMPGREYTMTEYRYGFNGMERDNNVSGDDNSYTTEFRQLDVRLGRWFSRDPIDKPFESDYAGFSNSPIVKVDPNGDSDYYTADGKYLGSDGTDGTDIHIVTDEIVIKKILDNRVQSTSDPSYFLYDATLETGTFFTLPPYNERQKIKESMDKLKKDAQYEIGGRGYVTTDGKETIHSQSKNGKKVEDNELIDWTKEYVNAINNQMNPPEVPFEITHEHMLPNVYKEFEDNANKNHGGVKLNYVWHSHPSIIVYYKINSSGSINVSLTLPDDQNSWQTLNFGSDEKGFASSDPSPHDISAASENGDYVMSKAAGTVTHYKSNGQITTLKAKLFYDTKAKEKPKS